MKKLQEYLSINEDNHNPDDYKEAGKIISKYIKELEDTIGRVIGVRNLKLNVFATPQKIAIESDNLLPQLKDNIWDMVFDDIHFETWGGEFTNDGRIKFNPKLSWSRARTSNRGGYDFDSDKRDFGFYSSILFDLNTKEWIFDK